VFAAGLGCGMWKGLKDIGAAWKLDRAFRPRISAARRKLILDRWHAAITLASGTKRGVLPTDGRAES